MNIDKRHKVNPVEPSITKPPKKFIEKFAKTLLEALITELENNNDKPHKSKLFTADVILRHVLPHVLNDCKNPQKKLTTTSLNTYVGIHYCLQD